ncbi:RNA polymerase sigma factor [Dyadobacter frigoris]|uniref:Sigma-70 family RNA polymerase sigma factor n=1 Tax=Dyadobacter frigoris TaxID=2576211 RepID=A0A4U6DBC8_9BACT|nr:sigma-70 family RNA polymerase sigma factor [Dyadobacter frigoris]TKT91634.1 sigma-70 family RNA polymerase sigma factor [Dyadobacter frigoris]GLU51802.1 DNA-directed RNA polymerase sigma-70 factor [Dyadobacter frigoris]
MDSVNKTYFIEVIQEHQGIINSICRIYYIDNEDIKDAKQDIILQLWKSMPTFRNESKISTWIYKVALNTILTKVKHDKKTAITESLSDNYPENNSDDNIHLNDDIQQLLFMIGKLEATEKAIMILHFEGYSNKEIAETLKLTSTNISTRMNRIRTKLKETFKSIYNELR